MKYEFFTNGERALYLANYLPKGMVTNQTLDSDGDVKVEIVIESNSDLLQVFHAGIHFGIDKASLASFNFFK
jgi:hypothetical protein